MLDSGRRGVFTIAHFDNYAAVLIELSRAGRATVTDLLADGWAYRTPQRQTGANPAKPGRA